MEFTSKEKFNGNSDDMDVTEEGERSKRDSVMSSSYFDDNLCTAAEMISFDTNSGWFSSPVGMNDLLSPSFLMSPHNIASAQVFPSFVNQFDSVITTGNCEILGDNVLFGDEEFDLDEKFDLKSNHSSLVGCIENRFISRPFKRSLSEKLLTALHHFKDEAGGGILAQVWLPIKNGDDYILSTCEQPYLLDQTFSGYREISRLFTFSAESKPGCILGLPGRVFSSKVPEWTSNILYYNKAEYLRVQYAADYEVRGSIGLPVLECDSVDNSCCAVLELVTRKEKSNFDSEIENVSRVLQSVNLRSIVPPRLYLQNLSKDQRAALSDIADILRSVCHVHRLPLALTWIPCIYTEEPCDEIIKIQPKRCGSILNGKCVLCIEDTASYVNDKNMKGFVHACLGHYIEEGQGVSGKALKSAHPFFCPNVKDYHISEYPLVHHARKFGLNAAVAIRLRSTHTENDDYILEFFLPVTVSEATEQQLLLNSLSTTMQRICTSLRTVSDTDFLYRNISEVQSTMEIRQPSTNVRRGKSSNGDRLNELPTLEKDEGSSRLNFSGIKKPVEKKRSTAEKHVSLTVLQQYFSGSLKDAAKSIGVCPTTLKRICREHGIARWPSRKINKLNRSLRKLQGVIDSVGGGLEFDSSIGVFGTGFFVEAGKSGDCFTGECDSLLQDGKSAKNDTENEVKPLRSSRNPDPSSVSSKHKEGLTNTGTNQKPYISQNLNSLMVCEEAKQEVCEDKQTTSSNRTELSNGSDSMIDGSCSSSRSFQRENCVTGASFDEKGSKITVKCCYKEDKVRFKFDTSESYYKLYETVSMRFKLEMGQFQIKYLDDENEWIVLVNDSDMRECIEVLEYQGFRHLKITVCDAICDVGSSGGSNCHLGDNS